MGKILINNIYYMLSYAYQVLQKDAYRDCGAEEFDNIEDLLSCILVKGVKSQLKRGISKDYKEYTEPLSCLRGKINVNDSLRKQTMLKKQLVCTYDIFTTDEKKNRIIKSTIEALLKIDLPKDRKIELRRLLPYFSGVKTVPLDKIDWHINQNKNNQVYQMLISICYLINKGMLQTKSQGSVKLLDFIDKQSMARLYEKFILEYYRKEHKELSAEASQIAWALDDGMNAFLPKMRSDVTLSYENKILIIDAKYYQTSMQERFNVKTVNSNNLYQIFTYVKNKKLSSNGPVQGMLLYAKTDEDIVPDFSYQMSGNKISTKTLDLNRSFIDIRRQLDNIAYELENN